MTYPVKPTCRILALHAACIELARYVSGHAACRWESHSRHLVTRRVTRNPVLNTRTQRAVRCHEVGTVWLLLKIWSIFPVFIHPLFRTYLLLGILCLKESRLGIHCEASNSGIKSLIVGLFGMYFTERPDWGLSIPWGFFKNAQKIKPENLAICWPLGPPLAVAGRT